jgi:hypothetical protein
MNDLIKTLDNYSDCSGDQLNIVLNLLAKACTEEQLKEFAKRIDE